MVRNWQEAVHRKSRSKGVKDAKKIMLGRSRLGGRGS